MLCATFTEGICIIIKNHGYNGFKWKDIFSSSESVADILLHAAMFVFTTMDRVYVGCCILANRIIRSWCYFAETCLA